MKQEIQNRKKEKKREAKGKNVAIYLYALLFNLTFFYVPTFAQETVPATGGNAVGSGGSVSYSVGQVVYTTNTSTASGSVAQGVQQPYEISVVTAIETAKEINLSVSAYPNPTTDFLILKIEGNVKTQYIASLFDITGKLLQSQKITGNQTNIAMSNLVPATYFVKVTDGSKEVKTFKIVKR